MPIGIESAVGIWIKMEPSPPPASSAGVLAIMNKKGAGYDGGDGVNLLSTSHLSLAPEMDPLDLDRRFVRSSDSLARLIERGEELLPPSLQLEIQECLVSV